jgi:hypothetical protein
MSQEKSAKIAVAVEEHDTSSSSFTFHVVEKASMISLESKENQETFKKW